MTEFWAAIIGAVVGGVFSLGLQWIAARSARKARQEDKHDERAALVLKLFYTLQKAMNDLDALVRQIEDGEVRVRSLGGSGGFWRGLQPISNLPRDIEITPAELTVVFRTGRTELFNDIRDVEAIHNAAIKAWTAYGDFRQTLASLLPAKMSGQVGAAFLSDEEMRRAGPTIGAVESLAEALRHRAPIDATVARRALSSFLPVVREMTGHSITMTTDRPLDPPTTKNAG